MSIQIAITISTNNIGAIYLEIEDVKIVISTISDSSRTCPVFLIFLYNIIINKNNKNFRKLK